MIERIKFLRTKLGMTQKDIAIRLGVSQSAVSKWENGKAKPSHGLFMFSLSLELSEELKRKRLTDLTKFLNCTVDDLLKREAASLKKEMERERNEE